jgi:pyridoxine 4-dehydrogenase
LLLASPPVPQQAYTENALASKLFCGKLGWPRRVQNAILTSPVVVDLGAHLGATPTQVALAWLLDLAPNVLLIPGTRTRRHLAENTQSACVRMDDSARAEMAGHYPIIPAQ